MLLFSRLRVGSKLALLAGVPILGILLLSALVVRDVQQRAQVAAGLGSLEDLARLSEQILVVIDRLQWERAVVSRDAGRGSPGSEEAQRRQSETDAALRALEDFLAQRDETRLPPKLRQDVSGAREQLQGLPALRERARQPELELLSYLDFFTKANDALIRATAALTQLSEDKSLLMSIGGLVSAMQVIERNSREHALLNYVFARSEFPPGTFRYLVTLVTEQEVYTESLRTWASEEEFARLKAQLRGPRWEQIAALRRAAIETTEDALQVEVALWSEEQTANMQALVQMERQMAGAVRAVVSAQMATAQGAVRIAGGLVAAIVLASALIGIAVTRSLTRSVRVLSLAAESVHRNNDFATRAEKTSSDELGLLTDAFNGMLGGIQERERELVGYRNNLEALVAARTEELVRRNAEMRLVLDTIDQGLASIDREGHVLAECSRSFEQAFGPLQPGTPFPQLLSPYDERLRGELACAYDQLMAEVLPLELALDQLPKHLEREGRYYALSFRPVQRDGKLAGTLLVTRDETSEQAARRAEAEQRERLLIFERIMRDADGFREMVLEAERLVAQITSGGGFDAARLRALHTLKGVAAVSDVASVARAAHALEQALAGDQPEIVVAEHEKLLARWDVFQSFVTPILGRASAQRLELTSDELAQLIARVRQGASQQVLLQALTRLSWEPLTPRLERMAEQLVRVARRLGRPEPRVVVEARDLRIPPEALRPFWSSFPHVVRNIVDHALQAPEERQRQGKTLENQVRLSARLERERLLLEIDDDGRGIDWERLAQRAKQSGLAASSRSDLVEALFADGISTAEQVSETSGRGVGMSAVRAACVELGGSISVQSERGQGTRFRFELPIFSAGKPGYEHQPSV